MVPNIEGVTSEDVGMIDYFSGTMFNETSDENYVATANGRTIVNNQDIYDCLVLDTKNELSCFYFVFYIGSPEWHFKSNRSKPICYQIHKNEIFQAKFPKYISYNYDTSIVSYIYNSSQYFSFNKFIIHASDPSNTSMDNYILGSEAVSGFALIPNKGQIEWIERTYKSTFKLKWIGPLNAKYISLTIYMPLYTLSNYSSELIPIITRPNIISALSTSELDTLYVWDTFSLPVIAMCYDYPVNNAMLQLFVEDFNSPQSYGVGNPLFAIYMVILGENKVFDFISSPNCALRANTSIKYTGTNGKALFWPYFTEGKPGKYTIYIRYNSLFTEGKSIILKNRISKVLLQSNITQIINVPFKKLNNIIYPQTVTLTTPLLLKIADEYGNPVMGKENSIKAYIFNIEEINEVLTNKHITKEHIIVADFETSVHSLNSTTQRLGFLLKVLTNQINTQKLFYTQTETYNTSISSAVFNGSHYLLNNVNITFENEGRYAIIFSVDGIESILSDWIIIKSRNPNAILLKWMKNVSLFMMIGLLIISNIFFAKYIIFIIIALAVVFGYSIKNETTEYYSFYYVIITLLAIFLLYFLIKIFTKSFLAEGNTFDISYRTYLQSKLSNHTASEKNVLNDNFFKSKIDHKISTKREQSFIAKVKNALSNIYKLLTPNYEIKFNDQGIIFPTRILLGVVLGLFATSFILIKLINFYLIISQKINNLKINTKSIIVKEYSTICMTIKSMLNIEVNKEEVAFFENSLQYYIDVVSSFQFALRLSFTLSSIIAVVLILFSSLMLLHQFKKDVLKYRVGNCIYKAHHKQVSLANSSNLAANVIISNAIGFILIISIFTIILTPICMSELYSYLSQYRTIILIVFVPWVAEFMFSKIYTRFGFKRGKVANRIITCMYDVLTTILFVLGGITISFVRFVTGVILVLLITGIAHKPMLPKWMESHIRIDFTSLSYISEVISYNQFHHPMHRCSAILLRENIHKHSDANKKIWKLVALSLDSKY